MLCNTVVAPLLPALHAEKAPHPHRAVRQGPEKWLERLGHGKSHGEWIEYLDGLQELVPPNGSPISPGVELGGAFIPDPVHIELHRVRVERRAIVKLHALT